MQTPIHRFHDLFAQLGLPNGEAEIAAFLAAHRPLPSGVALPNAPFWTPTQSAFLRDERCQDADWAELIDQLSLALR